MAIDDRTTNRSYQLPNAGNFLAEDVVRLRAALAAIDADIFARYTKVEVDQLITNLINGAPGALDTLNELADALGDDANFAATVAAQLAQKANANNVYTKGESDARYVQGSTQTEMVFIATANQSVFTLSTAVINKPSALVTVDGVVQPTAEYSLNMAGTQLTLSEGVPAGTVVRVLALGVASAGAPADDTVTEPKLRTGAVSTRALAEGIAPIVSSLNGGQLAGMRNRIINGDARVGQRGSVTFTATNNLYGWADRWLYSISATTVSALAFRATGILGAGGPTSGAAIQVGNVLTTGTTTVAVSQRIESINCFDLNSASITVSGKVLQTTGSAQTLTVSLSKANAVDNFAAQTVISSTAQSIPNNTWTSFTWTTTLGSTDASNGLQLSMAFNSMGAQSTTQFYFGDIQLEPGTVATPFERRSYSLEEMLCQRYFRRYTGVRIVGYALASNEITQYLAFSPPMRIAPTMATIAGGSSANATSLDYINASALGVGVQIIAAATGRVGVFDHIFQASAEL